jgi:L-asparaginase II
MADNPILVEVTRGALVESRHRGAVAVCDARGGVVFSLGDIDQPIFPRSAVKSFQALPLVESGAADKVGLTPAEIAMCCASHTGEHGHTETAARMLARVGRDVGCLECGTHWPTNDKAAQALAAAGAQPSALHNNCSGKHSGFVCLACAQGVDPKGYIGFDHPVQEAIRRSVSEMTDTPLGRANAGIDGCSIPTYAIPLRNLAKGFARLATGEGLPADRAAACRRIRESVAENPWYVSGTGKFDTVVMERLGARLFQKGGAEGVMCGALPEQGLGIAVKCDDGDGRGAHAIFGALVERFLQLDDGDRAALTPTFRPRITNWNKMEVGQIRPAGPLA